MTNFEYKILHSIYYRDNANNKHHHYHQTKWNRITISSIAILIFLVAIINPPDYFSRLNMLLILLWMFTVVALIKMIVKYLINSIPYIVKDLLRWLNGF